MATGLPSLPSEIIEKIVVFLPLQDVANSMLVCKQWNVSVCFHAMDRLLVNLHVQTYLNVFSTLIEFHL